MLSSNRSKILFSWLISLATLVVVSCQSTGDVRLRGGGLTAYEGRVEIYYNGLWGTVCDDSWDMNDSRVVCRQLGYDDAVEYYPNAEYGQGSGNIWMDEVSCSGSESALSHCSFPGWGQEDCDHREDVSVVCSFSSSSASDGDVRLVGGSSSEEGRVEIYHNGVWGTVCDDDFSKTDAEVVCRQLGHSTSNVEVHDEAHYGRGSGTIWLDDVNCYGHESRLSHCNHNGWGNQNCDHGEDVGVNCDDTNLAAIIAIVVTVPIVFIIIVVIAIAVCVRYRSRARRPTTTTVAYSGVSQQAVVQSGIHATPGGTSAPPHANVHVGKPEDQPPSYTMAVGQPWSYPPQGGTYNYPPPQPGGGNPPPLAGTAYVPAQPDTGSQPLQSGGTYAPPQPYNAYPPLQPGNTYPISQPGVGSLPPLPGAAYPPAQPDVAAPPLHLGGTYPPPQPGGSYPPSQPDGAYPAPQHGHTYPPP